jgi:hypothetical protein
VNSDDVGYAVKHFSSHDSDGLWPLATDKEDNLCVTVHKHWGKCEQFLEMCHDNIATSPSQMYSIPDAIVESRKCIPSSSATVQTFQETRATFP